MERTYPQWIGVDLDGTLAVDIPPPYPNVGPPIPRMVERVKRWLAEGKEVRIVTARLSPERHDFGDTVEEQRAIVQAWTLEHIGKRLQVQSYKDGRMVQLWDDRAQRVERNTGQTCCEVLCAPIRNNEVTDFNGTPVPRCGVCHQTLEDEGNQ